MDIKTICSKGQKHARPMRVGRGISSKGKTCGRGTKGRGARSGASRRPGYEGGQMPLYRRVPKRGFTNARFRKDYTVINVDKLDAFEDGTVVDLKAILDAGLVSMNTPLLKVLGNGDLGRKLTVQAHKFSKTAADKIAAVGGQAVLIDKRGKEIEEASASK